MAVYSDDSFDLVCSQLNADFKPRAPILIIGTVFGEEREKASIIILS
jgi:hypothetical protein